VCERERDAQSVQEESRRTAELPLNSSCSSTGCARSCVTVESTALSCSHDRAKACLTEVARSEYSYAGAVSPAAAPQALVFLAILFLALLNFEPFVTMSPNAVVWFHADWSFKLYVKDDIELLIYLETLWMTSFASK
jgi:hypothetical protein